MRRGKPRPTDSRQLLLHLTEQSLEPPPLSLLNQILKQMLSFLQRLMQGTASTKTKNTLQTLNWDYFPWPSTDAPIGRRGVGLKDCPKKGLLRHSGYSVSERAGKSCKERDDALARVFQLKVIPQFFGPVYVKQWGHPCSSVRLRKMAESIAAFCRCSKRRAERKPHLLMGNVIRKYEEDLARLKEKYYDGKFDRPLQRVFKF